VPTTMSAAQRLALGELRQQLLTAYFALLAAVLASRSWRDWRARRERVTASAP